MLKFYSLVCTLLLSVFAVNAQPYTVVGSAIPTTPNFPNATCFNLTPLGAGPKGAVWSTTTINLNQSFSFNTNLFFGSNDAGADGLAFVLQSEGPGYMGNEGAGLGYHRFPWDIPGPVPSFIVEFDTYMNGFIGGQNIGDPVNDHLGFMSNSNAYHTSPTALRPPIPFPINIEDNQWHPVTFSWDAVSKTMTVAVTLSPGNIQTYSYTGDIVNTLFGGNPNVYWGFTASTGGTAVTGAPGNEHKVCITPTSPCANDGIPPTITCPPTQFLCYKDDCNYTVPGVTATDNCGTPTVTYVVTGATSRSGQGNSANGCFNVGTSSIIYTARDGNGNVARCTTQVVVAPKLMVMVQDVYAVNPGGDPNTIYLGYGSTSLTLTANASGGTGPYSYMWTLNGSTIGTGQTITVSPSVPGEYNYNVTVTDARGCKAMKTIKVKVKDSICGGLNGNKNKEHKVVVCHVPPGNPGNAHVICIDYHAVPAHLAHGCYLGPCTNTPGTNARGINAEEVAVAINEPLLVLQPNPSKGQFQLQLSEVQTGTVQIIIRNATGSIVERRSIQAGIKGQTIKFDLSRQTSGIYMVQIITKNGIQTQRVIINK